MNIHEALDHTLNDSRALFLLAAFKWHVHYDQTQPAERRWGVYATLADVLEHRPIVLRATPSDALLAAGRLAGQLAGTPAPAASDAGGQAASERELVIPGDEDVSA